MSFVQILLHPPRWTMTDPSVSSSIVPEYVAGLLFVSLVHVPAAWTAQLIIIQTTSAAIPVRARLPLYFLKHRVDLIASRMSEFSMSLPLEKKPVRVGDESLRKQVIGIEKIVNQEFGSTARVMEDRFGRLQICDGMLPKLEASSNSTVG